MSQLKLNLKKSAFNEKLLPLLLDYSHRFEGYKGSAGSGKSYFITQKIIIRCCNEKIRCVVCRRYGSTLRNTVFSLFKEVLQKWQLIQHVKIRETDMHIQFPNGSEIIFLSLDEETKLLSLNNINCIFVEEVFEVPRDIFEQLNLRLRGQQANQQILFAFNPINKNHWLYDFCVIQPPQSFVFSETTYRDNKYLSKEYTDALEELYIRNPQKARIYCDGEWGADVEGLVFQNWTTENFDELELARTCEHRAGLDFGWQDPTAIVDTLFDKQNKIIYVFNETYAPGMSLDQIYQSICNMKLQKSRIYCDSADPRGIEFLRDKGVPAQPSLKGQGSVEARIGFLQNHKIIVKPNCKNVIRELENFSYIKDRNGQYTKKTTHDFSHSLDALGYAYSDIYSKHTLRTLDKSVLGL